MSVSIAAGLPVIECGQPLMFTYSEEDGHFYAHDPLFTLAKKFRPETFFQSIANAVECSRQHRPWERTAQIINLADHAAASGNSGK